MLKLVKLAIIACVLVIVSAAFNGCSSKPSAPQTEPQVIQPKEPSIEELRKPVSKDPYTLNAMDIVVKKGKLKKKSISYQKYQQLTNNDTSGAVNPDWFYDTYEITFPEEKHWITVIFGTAKKAKTNDKRIGEVMTDLPENSITITLELPSGKKYLLVDSEADGILDFTKEANQPTSTKVDIPLLDRMQEKYSWVLGVLKKYYKK